MNKKEIIQKLTDKDNKKAYEYAKIIEIESAKTNKYLDMIPDFANMLKDDNSYIRTRFFVLICNQARWAKNKQIENIYNQMEPLLYESKPTVVRQCLKGLKEVVTHRPEMNNTIIKTLSKIKLNLYKDTVAPLIKNDIEELTKRIINTDIHQ